MNADIESLPTRGPCSKYVIPSPDAGGEPIVGRGLHSSTFQLNLSAFSETGGAVRGCFGGV